MIFTKKKTTTKIFDTSSLLLVENLLEETCNIVITNITLKELEQIKNSNNKDSNTKYSARQILKLLNNNSDLFECAIFTPSMEKWLIKHDIENNNDGKILAAAYFYKEKHPEEECYFYTNDLSLKQIAKNYLNVSSISIEQDDYKGYTEIYFTNEEMANFYSNEIEYGHFLRLKVNEYLNIYSAETRQRVDTLCWTGENFRPLKFKTFSSNWLGDIKPYKDDIYQSMGFDSLVSNQITMIKGPAGAGKSYIATGYLFYLLEKSKIDKIIIFCNTVATKNAARLGFYPGSRDEKLMDSQIGNFLASKLGGKIAVEQLINDEKIVLLPLSDIRGYDTSGMRAGIYITEAQNLDIELLKLALQRVGEDSIVILDGDVESQVDLIDYEGNNNGLRRASKVFRGADFYGEIELQQIHRSKIAELANKM